MTHNKNEIVLTNWNYASVLNKNNIIKVKNYTVLFQYFAIENLALFYWFFYKHKMVNIKWTK